MDSHSKQNAFRKMSTTLRFAPWVLLICVFTLASFLLFSDFSASKKETNTAIYLTKEKGASLIHSFEATLFSSFTWKNEEIENILLEQANRNDISFLAIVDENGVIIAASDKNLIGQKILEARPKTIPSPFVNGNAKVINITRDGVMEPENVFLVDKQLFVATTSIDREDQRNHKMRRHRERSQASQMSKMMREHSSRREHTNSRNQSQITESKANTANEQWNLRSLLRKEKQVYMVVGFGMQDILTAQIADDARGKILKIVFAFLLILGVFSFFILRAYQRSYTMTQEGKAYILSLMDALPLGIIILDHNNNILTMNPNAENLTNYMESQSIGNNITEIIPQLYNNNFETNVENMTITIHRADGNNMTIEVNSFPILTNNENRGHGIILRDLHEIQKLQEELDRQERLASIGKLAAGIAHEIRNPLGSIKGIARLFEENAEKESEEAKLASIMTQEVMRVDKVVSDLLELSKPNTMTIKKTNLKELIEKTKNSVLVQTNTDVVFTENLCTQCEDVFLDENRIIQVLQNIFLNSIQAMKKNGKIHIEAQCIQEKTQKQDDINQHDINKADVQDNASDINKDENIQSNMYEQNRRYHNNLLEIIISDNGKGIAKENIKNIFTPYYTDKAKGTGLGLVMVQKIVQAHNGTVSIQSEENGGTKVIIRIPQ